MLDGANGVDESGGERDQKTKCDDAIKDNMLHFYEAHNSRRVWKASLMHSLERRESGCINAIIFRAPRAVLIRFMNNLLIATQKNFQFDNDEAEEAQERFANDEPNRHSWFKIFEKKLSKRMTNFIMKFPASNL